MNKEYKSYVRFLKTAKIEIRRLTNPSIRKKKTSSSFGRLRDENLFFMIEALRA